MSSKFPPLNLSLSDLKFQASPQGTQVWDAFRKKWLLLTPEEWVRQFLLHHLVNELVFPKSLIVVEYGVSIAGNPLRLDALVYKNDKPSLIIECKAPQVKLTQEVLDQASRYNYKINCDNLLISNGLEHFFCSKKNEEWQINTNLPAYNSL